MTTPTAQYSIKLFQKHVNVRAQTVLLMTIVMAILLRVGAAFLHGNEVQPLPGIFDQVSYDSLAQRLIAGDGFSFAELHWPLTRGGEPTAHWSYLYTLYLTAIYALFGHQPILARLLQAVIVGGMQTYLVYLIAEKTFSRSVGLIAAVISALYIYFVYYGAALMTEPFYITTILWSLLLAMHIAESNSRAHDIKLGLWLGIAIGITIVLRQVFLLFIPFLFIWMWTARLKRRLGLPILSTALSFAVIALCVVPISLYNQSRFGRFVLLNTNSGYAFFWGNHPIHGTQFIPILPGETYQDLIPEELRSLDEAALDQALLKRGVQFIVEDPKRYVLLSLSRIPAYFMFWPSSESSLVSNISRVGSFGIALPFMLYGMVLSFIRTYERDGKSLLNLFISPEGLLFMFTIIYTAVHLLTWALIRYRLPVDAVLLPFAAFALSTLYERVKRKHHLVYVEATA
jgi:4-amino-4-deoxy-L-arabinose transferase-like glycosyltransferase